MTVKEKTENIHDCNDCLFNVETLAKYLDVSASWIYQKTYKRELPFIKISKKALRFRKSDIDRWLLKRKNKVIDEEYEI